MRILLIPHTRWFPGVGHRAEYLVDHLKKNHEIHVITWSEPPTASVRDFANPAIHLQALIPWRHDVDRITLHHLPRWCLHRLPSMWRRNQRILDEGVRRIVREYGIEAIIFGPSAYLIGYPPTGTGASLIFDYVDRTQNEILEKYLERADTVTCASRSLVRQVRELNRNAIHVPNGADGEGLLRADASRVRAEYSIQDRLVVSLIGLTCSPDLYFVDSLRRLSRDVPGVTFLFVGKGAMYKPLRRSLRSIRDRCIWTGWVPREHVYDYFAASDIGLYPGGDTPYFRSACPIKLLEYAAARKPSVSSPVEEIGALGLESVVQVGATSEAFYDGILRARSLTAPDDSKRIPSWQEIATRFEGVLKNPDDMAPLLQGTP